MRFLLDCAFHAFPFPPWIPAAAFSELPGHHSFPVPLSPDKLHFLCDLATWQGNRTSQIAHNPCRNCSLCTEEKKPAESENDFWNKEENFLTKIQALHIPPPPLSPAPGAAWTHLTQTQFSSHKLSAAAPGTCGNYSGFHMEAKATGWARMGG